MSYLGVLVVHGMGNQPATFADDFIDEVRGRILDLGKSPSDIRFRTAYWSPAIDGRENELYRLLSQDHDLDGGRIRRDVVLSGLGDAVAYMGPPKSDSQIYDQVHEYIARPLADLRNSLTKKDKAPLIIAAHSLGCAIVSNYLWDAQHKRYSPSATTAFSRGHTLSGMITFGCNLPLFTLALKLSQVKPIGFPGSKAAVCFPGTTAKQRKEMLKWLNYFDADDILGYPLKPINAAYNRTVNEDVQIQTGSILGAHTGYWTDNSFTKPVARQLASVLELSGR